jgi:sarcosine oxidase
MLAADEIRRRFPAFTPADDEIGLFEDDAGVLRPEAAIVAQTRLAGAAGADLRTGLAVEDWTAGDAGNGVTVRTSAGTIRADRLVLTPGAWASGLDQLGVPLRVERRVQHYWRGGSLFGAERLPVWIWDYGRGRAAYGLPNVDGAVKAALHHGDDTVDPNTGADPVRPGEIARMPQLSTRLPGRATGSARNPASTHSLPTAVSSARIRIPTSVAPAISGHGKFFPVVAEILADQPNNDLHPIGRFDRPGFAPLARESCRTGMQNARDRVRLRFLAYLEQLSLRAIADVGGRPARQDG